MPAIIIIARFLRNSGRIAEPSESEKNDRRYEKAYSRYAHACKTRKRTTCARSPYACDIPAKCIVFVPAVSSRISDRTCIGDRHPNRRQRGWCSVKTRSRYKGDGAEWTRSRYGKYREHEPRILRLSEFRDEHAAVENRSRSNERVCVWRSLASRWLVLNARSVHAFASCAPFVLRIKRNVEWS